VSTNERPSEIGKVIKQQRVIRGLTLEQLGHESGVSPSYLGRIEKGERFPSAHILKRIAQPLGFEEGELLIYAGYLSPSSAGKEDSQSQDILGRLDPYVASLLSQEPVEIQHMVVAVLTIFKSVARETSSNIGFTEYIHRNYPEVDDDIITMIKDILEHPPKAGYSDQQRVQD